MASTTMYYLSANNTLDGNDIPLGSRAVPALSAGDVSSGATSVTIPAGTPGGTYYIIAKADGGDAVPEINKTNNMYVQIVTISQ